MKDYITGLGGLALSGYLYTVTKGFAAEGGGLAKNPAYYPNVLLLILAALSAALVISALFRREKPSVSADRSSLMNTAIVFGMILVYIVALEHLGFIVSTLTFIFCGVLLYGGSVKASVFTAIPVTAAVYLVFHVLLKVVMPQGLLI